MKLLTRTTAFLSIYLNRDRWGLFCPWLNQGKGDFRLAPHPLLQIQRARGGRFSFSNKHRFTSHAFYFSKIRPTTNIFFDIIKILVLIPRDFFCSDKS